MPKFFETMRTGYQIMGQEAKQKIIDNRANILTGVSVLGTIGTAVASWFGGAKSARMIDAEAINLGRPLTTKEKAKLCWKNTIVPVGTTLASCAGSVTSNRIMAGDIARLTTDVAVVTKAYNEFKKATNEVVTEKQQQQIKDATAVEKREDINTKSLPKPADPEDGARLQLFKDGFSGVVFWSNVDKVRLAETKLQKMMAEMRPRRWLGYYSTQEVGVPYREWLAEVKAEGCSDLSCRDVTLYSHFGWNKGYWEDDDDDDIISFYLSPGEVPYHGEMRSCYVITWDQDPTDLKTGDMLKKAST